MFASSFFVYVLAALSAASASPLRSRATAQMCRPSFEGAPVSITNSAREWAVNGTEVRAQVGNGQHITEFRLEFTGSPTPTYLIKDVNNNEMVVALNNDNTLKVTPIDANDGTQQWDVICDSCQVGGISESRGLVHFGCNITSIARGPGLCAQIGASETVPMFLAPCDNSDAQNFDFWTDIGEPF